MAFLVNFAFPASVHALTTIPYKLNFQGRLTDASGNPMAAGTYNMKFRIYDASSGGTLKWSEQRANSASTGVTVTTGGLFSVQLGDVSSLPANIFSTTDTATLYFEIELPTPATATCTGASCESYTEGPMTPRNKLASSAYSFNSDLLDGLDSSAFAQVGSNTSFTGTLGVNLSSSTAFTVGASGTNVLTADTTNALVKIGTADSTSQVLVLDTNTADPGAGATSTNGAMYYNSTSGKFRCYQGAWTDCITAAGGATLQTAYTASTGGTTPEIKADATRAGFDIQDADTTIAGTLFAVRGSNAGGLGTALFDVSSTGAAQFTVPSASATAFTLQTAASTKLFVADSTSARIYIGGSAVTTNPITLVLSNASSASDPTGVAGSMYYSTAKDAFRCYEAGIWRNCIGNTDSTSGYRYANDLLGSFTTTGDVFASSTGTGAATATSNATIATNRPGTFRSTTGTTTTGRAAFGSTTNALALGGGLTLYETAVNVTTLSDATNRYSMVVGFYDSTTANQVDAVSFVYDEGGVSTGSTASANWQVVTSSNSTRTWTTTTTAVGAGTWVKLGIIVNAAGTSVGFYINGTLVATHTANIPTGTARALGFGSRILKSVGTTARTVDIDYLQAEMEFTTPR